MGTHVRERERCVPEFTMVEVGALRACVEETIEWLIAILDALDGDHDDEEGDPPEDDGAREPWLGSIDHFNLYFGRDVDWNQERWALSGRSDRERDAGDEPEYDEADLGIADEDALRLVLAAGPVPVDAVWRW